MLCRNTIVNHSVKTGDEAMEHDPAITMWS